jgi:hypothetical protein
MTPVSATAAGKKQHQIDGTQLAKTRLCLFYQEGRCKYGSECTYAHNVDEVRKAPEELRKTKFCELFMDPTRGCVDPDCNFAHYSDELRSKKDARRKARASLRVTPSSVGSPCGVSQQQSPNSSYVNTAPRLSQVSSNALELMQQLAALLAAVQNEQSVSSSPVCLTPSPPPPPSPTASIFNYFTNAQPQQQISEDAAEQLTGLSEILGPPSPPSSFDGSNKRASLASTAATTPVFNALNPRPSFSLF